MVLEKYFQNKNCEAFLSVHEWAHDLYQKCHKRDPNVTPKCHKRDQTKYCIKRNPDDRISYEVYEIVCKYVVRHLCIAQYKIPNTSENFYFEVILSRTIVLCKVTNVTNRYMDFILDLDEEFNFQRPVCLDSNRMHYYQSKICCSMHVCTRSCSHSKVKFSTFFGHKRDAGMGQQSQYLPQTMETFFFFFFF